MSEINHITEIIPDFDKLPDWAREAFKEGQYHAVVSEKVIAYEAKLEAAEAVNAAQMRDRLVLLDRLETAEDFRDGLNEIEAQTTIDLMKAEATIKAISELRRLSVDRVSAKKNEIHFTTSEFGNVMLYEEVQAILKEHNDE